MDSDKWEFVLRGRTRKVETLSKAREAIDKVPKTENVPFPRFTALLADPMGIAFDTVEVTSYAGRASEYEDYEHEFWCVDSNERRSKEYRSRLFQNSTYNLECIEQMKLVRAEIKRLETGIKRVRDVMHVINFPEGVDAVELTEEQEKILKKRRR
jgi:hypothetical protein